MNKTKQEFPNITLVVKAGIPQIELRSSEENIKVITSGGNIEEFLLRKAKELGFEGDIDSIYSLISECDEQYIEFPEFNDAKEIISQ